MKETLSLGIPPLGSKDLPPAPRLRSLLGPSFILLGLGLGSGEVVLWPYMASQYGLGIVWGMLLGITMQFFINMEVARYALINGESIFVGFARLLRWLPIWFIISTFLGFGWPGIGLYGASLLSSATEPVLGLQQNTIGIILFIAIGIILSLGKVLYKTVEQLQKYLIGISVPIIVGLTCYLATNVDLLALLKGLSGHGIINGEPYLFLPPGIALGTFLGAMAYAGAGGNLNLTQSCYVRDKGLSPDAMNKLNLPVEEFTTPDPVTANEDTSIEELSQMMKEHGVRHLPIVRGARVVGIVSDRDLRVASGLSLREKILVQVTLLLISI